MIKAVLLGILILPISVFSFELDVNLDEFYIAYPNNEKYEYRSDIGNFNAKSFHIKHNYSHFSLKKNTPFVGFFSLDSERLYLENDQFEFSYSLEAVPWLKNLKFIRVKSFSLLTDDDSLAVTGSFGLFDFGEKTILAKNLDLNCRLKESILENSGGIIESCLNDSHITQKDELSDTATSFQFSGKNYKIAFNINYSSLSQDKIDINLGSFSFEKSGLLIGSNEIQADCSKDYYTTDVGEKLIVANCLKKAKIHAPNIIISDENSGFRGNLKINKLFSNGKMAHFQGPSLNLTTESENILAENINMFCKLPKLDENLQYNMFGTSCLKQSLIGFDKFSYSSGEGTEVNLEQSDLNFSRKWIKLRAPRLYGKVDGGDFNIDNINYLCPNVPTTPGSEGEQISASCFSQSSGSLENVSYSGKSSNMSMQKADLQIEANHLKLDTPKFSFSNSESSLGVEVNSFSFNCSRGESKELTVDSVLRGCFDSSQINISSIDIKHRDIESKIAINEISIDKKNLKLYSPGGKYSLNGLTNQFKNLKFDCDLDASYDFAKDSDWKSILENCIHSSKIDLGELKEKYNGNSKIKHFYEELKKSGLSTLRKVQYDSRTHKGDKFSIGITPRIFFVKVPSKIEGTINFNKEKEEINIYIKKARIAFLPARLFVRFILSAFIADENTVVKGNRIKILL